MRVVISTRVLCESCRALSIGITPVLAFLLVALTPVGTGLGLHADQLLDPVFPHLHFPGNVVRQGRLPTAVPQSVETQPQGLTLARLPAPLKRA